MLAFLMFINTNAFLANRFDVIFEEMSDPQPVERLWAINKVNPEQSYAYAEKTNLGKILCGIRI